MGGCFKKLCGNESSKLEEESNEEYYLALKSKLLEYK
jgi:hypothetical protein